MEITKEQLKGWYESMTNKDLCKKLDISEPTLTRLIKKSGIKLKGRGKGGQGANPKVRVI